MANHHVGRGEPGTGLFDTVAKRASQRIRQPDRIRVPARFHGRQIEIDLKPAPLSRARRLAQTEDRLFQNWLQTVDR